MKEYEARKQARAFLDYDDTLAVVAKALAGSPEGSSRLCRFDLPSYAGR